MFNPLHLLFNPLYLPLLPLTTIVDYLFTPPSVRRNKHYKDAKFFVCGIHAVAWLKLGVLLCAVVCLVLAEPLLDEVTFYQNKALREVGEFTFYEEFWMKLDRVSAAYMITCVAVTAAVAVPWLLIVALLRVPILLIPCQVVCFLLIYEIRYREGIFWFYIQTNNALAIYADPKHAVDEDFSALRHPEARVLGDVMIPRTLEPMLRNGKYVAGALFLLWIEFILERCMEHYGYKRLLDWLFWPVSAPSKWLYLVAKQIAKNKLSKDGGNGNEHYSTPSCAAEQNDIPMAERCGPTGLDKY
ncbi:hypothetical protein AAVH_11789 [Aphelenchoides avenae]|nr:hypothetical protein AAVH_11789 [Aphelenchus avenae]